MWGASLEERFWSKVNKNGPVPEHRPDLGPCHLWTAATTKKGYGQFWLDGRLRQAHTVAWEMKNGPIPPGLEPDHLCRVRHCVNDAHIEPVTKAENLRRGLPGRRIYNGARNLAKTHCPQGHPYAGENLYMHPAGKRVCRECRACKHKTTNHRQKTRAEYAA